MLNDFLNHKSKGDRRAIIALAVLAVLLVIALLIVDIVRTGDLIEAQKKSLGDNTKVSGDKRTSDNDTKSSIASIPLHEFDPNTVDSSTLVGFGIAPWKVKIFINYRNKGKRFSTPESILDTYKWEQADYELLRPYINIGKQYRSKVSDDYSHESRKGQDGRIASHSEGKEMYHSAGDTTYKRKYASAKFKTLTKIDLNTADSATLCSIPGVGGYISSAIIRYRNRLGGYASVSQVMDIKQVSPELLEWFEVNEHAEVKKININKDSFQKLNSHPYISYEQTRDVLTYRRLYGVIRDEAQLLQINVFSKEEVERLRPYLVY